MDKEEKESILKLLSKHLNVAKCTIEKRGIKAAQELADKRLKRWKEIEVTLAVIGQAGVGKSSFINAIRGLEDDGEESTETPEDDGGEPIVSEKPAKTGVTETTKKATAYRFPSNPKIKLYDLPGVGTSTFSDVKTYCKELHIGMYDTFIIMCCTRFLKQDAEFAQIFTSNNKPYFFVRTKVDVDCQNEERKRNFNKEKMLEKIRKDCSDNLNKLDDLNFDKEDIFLISNSNPLEYDFPSLTEAITDRLPSYKQDSFNLSMYILSEDILKRKVEILRGQIKYAAFRSILVTANPDKLYSRQLNLNFISECLKFYNSQLGLPDKESKEFQGMTKKLQKEVQRFDMVTDCWSVMQLWLQCFGVDEYEENPTLGWSDVAEAIVAPYSFVYRSLNSVLDEMTEVGLEILKDSDRKLKELKGSAD